MIDLQSASPLKCAADELFEVFLESLNAQAKTVEEAINALGAMVKKAVA